MSSEWLILIPLFWLTHFRLRHLPDTLKEYGSSSGRQVSTSCECNNISIISAQWRWTDGTIMIVPRISHTQIHFNGTSLLIKCSLSSFYWIFGAKRRNGANALYYRSHQSSFLVVMCSEVSGTNIPRTVWLRNTNSVYHTITKVTSCSRSKFTAKRRWKCHLKRFGGEFLGKGKRFNIG